MSFNNNMSQPSVSVNLTPANLISAFNTATSFASTYNNLKEKINPPSRPAPMPSGSNGLPNPLIPQ